MPKSDKRKQKPIVRIISVDEGNPAHHEMWLELARAVGRLEAKQEIEDAERKS